MPISSISSNSIPTHCVSDTVKASASEGSSANVQNDVFSDSANVKFSGRALMYSRLFHTDDLSREINFANEVGTTKGLSSNYFEYLTKDDRAFVASTYEYALMNNIDLRHVDQLAADLAYYREWGWVPMDDIYTTEGRKITVEFIPADKEIADQIKASDDFKSTTIDKGFLNFLLDDGRPFHATKFGFLSHMVSVFSPGAKPESSADEFSTFDSAHNEWVTHVSDEVDSRFIPEETDLISINGGPYFRNPKKDSVSNEDFMKALDKSLVSKYIEIYLASSTKKTDMLNVTTETNNLIGGLYKGVKKLIGG